MNLYLEEAAVCCIEGLSMFQLLFVACLEKKSTVLFHYQLECSSEAKAYENSKYLNLLICIKREIWG